MMKKLVLAAVALCVLAAPSLAAVKLTVKPLAWRYPSAGVGGTVAKKGLTASANDTTIWISTSDMVIPEFGGAAAVTDSVCVGAIIIQVDSSAAYAPGQATITATLQAASFFNGHTGSQENNPQNVLSTSILPTTGDDMVIVPLWIRPNRGLGHAPVYAFGGLPPFVRLVVNSNANMLAARVYLQHYTTAN